MTKPELNLYVDLSDACQFIQKKYNVIQEVLNEFEENIKDGVGQNTLVYLDKDSFVEGSALYNLADLFEFEFGVETKYEWWW